MFPIKTAGIHSANIGGSGFPQQLFGTNLLQRYGDEGTSPAGRVVNGTARAIDISRSGDPRQLQPGRCWTLDGVSDYVDCGDGTQLDAMAAFTASVWVRNTATFADEGVVSKLDGSTGWMMYAIGSGINAYIKDSGATVVTVSSGALTANQWIHACMTYDGVTLRLFIDGSEVGTPAASNAPGSNLARKVEVGRYNGSSSTCWTGQLADVRVFTRALTAAEVARIAAMAPGSNDIGPTDAALWFKCDEGGTTTRALNSGSLGSAADGTITAAAIATFHDDSVNDVYSFQNQVGYRPVATFDGTADNVKCPLSSAITDYPFAFGGWFRTSGGGTALSINDDSVNNVHWIIQRLSGSSQIRIVRRNTSIIATDIGSNTFPANAWTHIAVEMADATSVKVWVDGAVVYESTALTSVTFSGADTFTLGLTCHVSPVDYWPGDMFGAFARAGTITTGQVVDIMNGNFAGCDQAYFDGQQYGTTIIDESGNGNNGLLTATSVDAFWDGGIPRDEANPTKDRLGLTLPYTGSAPRDAVVSGPTTAWNGADNTTLGGPLFTPGVAVTAFTCGIWVKTPSTSGLRTACGQYEENSSPQVQDRFFLLGTSTAIARVYFGNAANVAVLIGNDVSDDNWHLLVGVYDESDTGAECKLYQDGVLVKTAAKPTGGMKPTATGDQPWRIGSVDNNGPGYIWSTADLTGCKVYERVLTPAEIGDWYNGTEPDRTSLKADWPLCEGDGTILHDVSGNQHHLTATVASTANFWANTQDVYDTLLKDGAAVATNYSGTGEYYDKGSRLTSGAFTAFSLATWIRPSQTGAAKYIASEDNSGQRIWNFYRSATDTIIFSMWTGASMAFEQSTPTIASGRLAHVAATYNAGVVKLYIDGLEVASTTSGTIPASAPNNTPDFELGSYFAGSSPWQGRLGDAVFEQAVWSQSTIRDIMAGTVPSTAWRFKNGDGTDVNQGVTIAATGTPDRIDVPVLKTGANERPRTFYTGSQNSKLTTRITSGGMDQLSAAAWIKVPSVTAASHVICGEDKTSARIWYWYIADAAPGQASGSVTVALFEDGQTNGTFWTEEVITEDTWHHVAFSYNGSKVNFWIDGVLATLGADGTQNFESPLADLSSEFIIGANKDGFPIDGELSDLIIEQDVEWDTSTVRNIMAGLLVPSGAWHFPSGNGYETNQGNLGPFTLTGSPKVFATHPAKNVGPSLLLPGMSLDVGCGEADAPSSQKLADTLADLTYDQGDDDEADMLFARVQADGDDRIATIVPAATGGELSDLQSWAT